MPRNMLTLFKERNLREKYPIIEGKRTEMYRRENAVLTTVQECIWQRVVASSKIVFIFLTKY